MIIIQDETTKFPLQLIGKEAGACWGAPTDNIEKNVKRAKDCIESGHGRTEEFPEVYMVIDGYSAKAIRELYTHIGGSPTRLQASTRYIDYSKGFEAVKPPKIENNSDASIVWDATIKAISDGMNKLKDFGIPTEDLTNLLPLAYKTKMIWKVNLRTLEHFMEKRLCTRAYWEIRNLSKDICKALAEYSDEWKWLVENLFKPECEKIGYCRESKCCGHSKKKEDVIIS